MGPFGQILMGFGLQILGYMMQPKGEEQKPPRLSQFKAPEASPGRVMDVAFGTVLITDPQILFTGQESIDTRQVSAKEKA